MARGALALGDFQRAISCCRVARAMAEQLGGKVGENAPSRADFLTVCRSLLTHCNFIIFVFQRPAANLQLIVL